MELARQMGTDEKAVRRMRDPMQATKVDSLETALRLLGWHAEVNVLERTANDPRRPAKPHGALPARGGPADAP